MMRSSTRAELNKLREIAWFVLRDQKCCFCHKPLLPKEKLKCQDGNGRGEPMPEIVRVTIHHRNGNHHDNRRTNKRLSHQPCHKRHHAKEILRGDWRTQLGRRHQHNSRKSNVIRFRKAA